jgi:hypothetical protein
MADMRRWMSKPTTSTFLWIRGQGPDAAALDRMERAFPKPRKPMGEAWFLAPEREMYPELLGDLDSLSDEQIYRPLEQIATGPSCFGQHEEWTEWYHYLLPRTFRRRWDSALRHPMEILITGFMGQHSEDGKGSPIRTFARMSCRRLANPSCPAIAGPMGRSTLLNASVNIAA